MKGIKHVIRYRIPLMHPDFPLVLFWSQKSGCTSWILWFLYQTDLLQEAIPTGLDLIPTRLVHQFINRDYTRRNNYRKELRDTLEKKCKPVVKLVRDPYRRAVSSFLMLSGQNVVRFRPHFAHVEWRKIREHFYGNAESCNGISFLQFLSFLEFRGVTPGECQAHFACQYVPGEEDFVTGHVRLESLQESLRDLELRYGLRAVPSNLVASSERGNRHQMNHSGPDADTMVFDERTSCGLNIPHYSRFLTGNAIKKIFRLYAKDIELYGYRAPFREQEESA